LKEQNTKNKIIHRNNHIAHFEEPILRTSPVSLVFQGEYLE